MIITSSNITKLEDMNIQNSSEGIDIYLSMIDNMINCTFSKNGNSKILTGAALKISDSSMSIQNSSFSNNTAVSGAALYFTCNLMTLCSLSIDDCDFRDNAATKIGGAIYYDFARPSFGNSIVFNNNSAQYGNNIASYAVKITFTNNTSTSMKIDNFGSGIAYPETLSFAVRDFDDQVMNLNSQDQIRMSATDSTTTEVRGFNSAPFRNGIAVFSNLIVIAKQGSEGIEISANSNAIDQNKIQKIFGSRISENKITTNIRYCQPGESVEGNS